MAWHELDASAWRERAHEPVELDSGGHPLAAMIVVHADGSRVGEPAPSTVPSAVGTGPVLVVVANTSGDVPADLAAAADVILVSSQPDDHAVVSPDPIEAARRVAEEVERFPVAAMSLAWLLRSEAWRDLEVGLLAESATYSMLLASTEVREWRESRPVRVSAQTLSRLQTTRVGSVLRVTLTHAARRNAMDARMRDELVEALQPAVWDRDLSVVVDAEGPSFSSGGDLDEFLSTSDVAVAHLVRSVSSVGRVLHGLGHRAEVHVVGACVGAGVEVPAFAGRVVARDGATFRLPEVSMGLVPGAGGTVSVPRRVGRRRAAWWMLSGATVDLATALSWGLVDDVV